MRAVVQRVRDGSVSIDGEISGRIDVGLLVYLGVQKDDTERDRDYIASKIPGLRIFPDESGTMNRCVDEVPGAGILVVSQFTLLGDARKGRRPSYNDAAPADQAQETYEQVVAQWRAEGRQVATGVFQAHMDVAYINDGPVTILVDSRKAF